jgi:hypothetical protein
MEHNFDIQIKDFINAYYYENSISAEEVKKIFGIEVATDEELFAEFTDYEIQMGNDEFEYLAELISALIYCKSIDDSLQYLKKLELLKEFNDFTMEKTLLNKYLEFEKTLFKTK